MGSAGAGQCSIASSHGFEACLAAAAIEEKEGRGLKHRGCLSCLMWVMNVIVQLAANGSTASPARKGCDAGNPRWIE